MIALGSSPLRQHRLAADASAGLDVVAQRSCQKLFHSDREVAAVGLGLRDQASVEGEIDGAVADAGAWGRKSYGNGEAQKVQSCAYCAHKTISRCSK